MIVITTEMVGFDRAFRRLAQTVPAVQKRITVAVDETISDALAIAEGLVPRRTGELASTLRRRMTRSGLAGYVEAGYGTLTKRVKGDSRTLARVRRRKAMFAAATPGVYAGVVEFSRKRGHPFLRPAIEQVRVRHAERMFTAIKDGINDLAEPGSGIPSGAA